MIRYTSNFFFFFLRLTIEFIGLTCKKTDLIVNLKKKKLLELYESYVKNCTTIIFL
jgi:hypothetical protein